MRTLHVAALPYPSPQGTQGLLHQMLSALAEAGHDTHLLCYSHGGSEQATPYRVHRIAARSFTRSLRSGPSLDKLWLDVSLAQRLHSLRRELTPDLVVAHHVEAALASTAPFTFVAHTSLSSELPVYFPGLAAGVTSALGRSLDSLLIRRAARCLAVSPLLAHRLSEESSRAVDALPLPWPVPAPSTTEERHHARVSLGLAADAEVVLYAGNLDAYQGLEVMLAGLSAASWQRPKLRFLLATAADAAGLQTRLQRDGIPMTTCPLDDEAARRRAHAAADLALVPRHSPGGVPIKLLEALSRGVPVLAAERALAGLPLKPYCLVIDGDSAGAWQRAIVQQLERPPGLAALARDYVQREHAAARFVDALLRQA